MDGLCPPPAGAGRLRLDRAEPSEHPRWQGTPVRRRAPALGRFSHYPFGADNYGAKVEFAYESFESPPGKSRVRVIQRTDDPVV